MSEKINQRTDWEQMIKEVNALIQRLQQKPESKKLGYVTHPGGILNAYREGDLTFEEAVQALEEWKTLGNETPSRSQRVSASTD